MDKNTFRRYAILSIITLTLVVIIPNSAFSQTKTSDDWVLKKNQNGIQIYTRKSTTSSVDDLKTIAVLNGSLTSVAALIMDANNFPNWIYDCKEGRILEQVSPTEQYQYQYLNAPYPVSDRDIVVHFTIRQDPETKIVYTKSIAVDGHLPLKKDVVRLPVFDGGYELQLIGENKVQVLYTLKMDPGGSIPDWLVNLTFLTGPYESTLKMQKQIERPEYRDKKLPFIAEP